MNLYPWTTVSQGETSDRVAVIQYLLRAHGQAVVVDRDFGPATSTAVRAVQAAEGLVPDGVVGPVTWPKLVIAVSVGSTGDAVRAVQSLGLLRFPGDDPLVVDGNFGPLPRGRVLSFQNDWGLTQDGIVGTQSWSFLTRGQGVWPLVAVGATQATNSRVLTVQHLLRAQSATIIADGIFGPLSGESLRQFQLDHRTEEISTTCGQRDWPDLIVTVGPGDNGEAVRAAQCLLQDVVVDGVFGLATQAAVRAFQEVFLPPSDGVVGPQTWQALVVPTFD
ncbi:MAG: peptidoglycan-binding protein [Propionicimonas sp.]